MPHAPPNPHIRQWTLAARCEPLVRIGVILDADAAGQVDVHLPDANYVIDLDGRLQAVGDTAAERTLTIAQTGDALACHIADQPAGAAARVRIVPRHEPPLTRGAGAVVRDVIAGRGFHWEKRIDQSLAGTLELLPGRRGMLLINELPLESYLAGVITAEMSGVCPAALLEAQCIVARAWLLALSELKHAHEPFDRCNDDCCQRYQGTGELTDAALAAVRVTRGRVLLAPNNQVLDANYSKSCGGISELPQHVWGTAKPGLSAIVDAPPGDPARTFPPITERNLDDYLDGAWLRLTRCYCSPQVVPVDAIGRYLGRVDTVDNYFRWTMRYTAAELAELLRSRWPGAAELAAVRELRVGARGISGRATQVEITWEDARGQVRQSRLDSEYAIRAALHAGFLYSSAFSVRSTRDARGRLRNLTLRGAGWGHGVGLCQIGALGMALCGQDTEALCRHYYPLATLATAYA